MKGVYLGQKFYRLMLGVVGLLVVYLYVLTLSGVGEIVAVVVISVVFVGVVLYLVYRGWIEKPPPEVPK